jgi:NADH-quinone oxidoreductase subunit J
MVLFLFVIMLLNLDAEVRSQGLSRVAFKACSLVGTGLLLLLLLGGGAVKALRTMAPEQVSGVPGNTQAVAELLFTKYLLPFEVTSILLLAAIVGALVLAGKRD